MQHGLLSFHYELEAYIAFGPEKRQLNEQTIYLTGPKV